jgi:hypothetical protein
VRGRTLVDKAIMGPAADGLSGILRGVPGFILPRFYPCFKCSPSESVTG